MSQHADMINAAVVIGGLVIPFSGEEGGTWFTFDPDDAAERKRGMARDAFSHATNRGGVLTLNARPGDPAVDIWWALYNQMRAQPGVPFPGSTNDPYGMSWSFADCRITQLPQSMGSNQAEVIQMVIEVSKATPVKVPAV